MDHLRLTAVGGRRCARHWADTHTAASSAAGPNNPRLSHRNFRIPQFDSQRSTSAKRPQWAGSLPRSGPPPAMLRGLRLTDL